MPRTVDREARNGTANDPTRALQELLGAINGRTEIVDDGDVRFHTDPNDRAFVVPQNTSYEEAGLIFQRKHEEMKQPFQFQRVFNYRPDDGAHAAAIVLTRMFGVTIGKTIHTMFGSTPPMYRTIEVGLNQTEEVPWELIAIPALPGAEIYLGSTQNEYGPVFAVSVTSPKLHKAVIETLMNAISAELRDNSIYRGKALLGANALKFMDVGSFDPSQIVFSDFVARTLEAGLWSVLEHEDSLTQANIPLRRSVLLYGDYGTGKSSVGWMTAQKAVKAGWTFLSAKAGRDNLKDTLQTAALYEPAVVLVEDIDAHTPNVENKHAIAELLDLLDGVAAKARRLVVIMTTNHIEDVPAGMLRPGRLDFAVEIAGLDRNGAERLFRAVVPARLLGDVDFDKVYEAMSLDGRDFLPAWVRSVADRASSFAIVRDGGVNFQLTTDDLVDAARSLHPQLRLMLDAAEGRSTPTLDEAFADAVQVAARKGITGIAVDRDTDSGYFAELVEDAS